MNPSFERVVTISLPNLSLSKASSKDTCFVGLPNALGLYRLALISF
jgi:hypothetical protein